MRSRSNYNFTPNIDFPFIQQNREKKKLVKQLNVKYKNIYCDVRRKKRIDG